MCYLFMNFIIEEKVNIENNKYYKRTKDIIQLHDIVTWRCFLCGCKVKKIKIKIIKE